MSTRQHDAHTRKKIQCTKIVQRLEEHIFGQLLTRVEVGKKIVKDLCEVLAQEDGFNLQLSLKAREALERRVRDCLATCGMDMSQVRAAEVLLKKSLPDLALVEYKGEVRHAHTVMLPAGMTPEAWAQAVQLGKDGQDAPRLVSPVLEHVPNE